MTTQVTALLLGCCGLAAAAVPALLCADASAQQADEKQPADVDPAEAESLIHVAHIGGNLGELTQRTKLTALVNDKRLVFMVWSNMNGSGGGSGSSDAQGGYRLFGFHKSTDGTQLIIKAQTDGVTGTAEVGGREFEMANGNIVLVRRIRGSGKDAVYGYRQIHHGDPLEGPVNKGLSKLSANAEIKAFFK